MLKLPDKNADKANMTAGCQPQTKRLKLRKKGMPRQKHIIPELEYPATSRQGRIEDRLINILDRR